jgi:hypothetical protein
MPKFEPPLRITDVAAEQKTFDRLDFRRQMLVLEPITDRPVTHPTASANALALHLRPGWSIFPPGRVPRSKCQPSNRPKLHWERSLACSSFRLRANVRAFPLFRPEADHFRKFGVFMPPSTTVELKTTHTIR